MTNVIFLISHVMNFKDNKIHQKIKTKFKQFKENLIVTQTTFRK